MRKITLAIICLILLTISTLAQTDKKSRWEDVALSDKDIYYLDKNRIEIREGIIKVWVKIVPVTINKGEQSTASICTTCSYTIQLTEFDCADSSIRIRAIIKYSKGGEVLYKTELVGEWFDVPPETLGDILLNAVCKTAKTTR